MNFQYLGIKFFIAIVLFTLSTIASSQSLSLKLTFDESQFEQIPKEGRLFLFVTKDARVEPKSQTWPNPYVSTHIFAKNLNLAPINGSTLKMDTTWLSSSDLSIEDILNSEYYFQAVWDHDTLESRMDAPGNIYSKKQKAILLDGDVLELALNQRNEERKLVEHELLRYVEFVSDTLSIWWDKQILLKASILLPNNYNYKKPDAIRYNVAGYGGRYDRANNLVKSKGFMDWWMSDDAPQVINVFLDGEGPFGDSYQMDSENSGPYGYALINELIPYIENKYRNSHDMAYRFVDGCSTGGWVSLGLQLYYPDTFNGVFSYSPDPVEFENYQLINIYKDENAFINEFGLYHPVMRDVSGEPMIKLKDFIMRENILGVSDSYITSGGQFSAHTALYSPIGDDGLPKPLFDPKSGEIDHSVADHWKKYDFKLYAQENWKNLGPKLAGKIYVWMGDMDHFYLNHATRKLSEFFESASNPSSDARFEFEAMKGHCSNFSHTTVLKQIQARIEEIDN